jgi:hypothetical protein
MVLIDTKTPDEYGRTEMISAAISPPESFILSGPVARQIYESGCFPKRLRSTLWNL